MLRVHRLSLFRHLIIPFAVGACAEGTKLEPAGVSSAGKPSVVESGGTKAAVFDGSSSRSDVMVGAGGSALFAAGGTRSWDGSSAASSTVDADMESGSAGAATEVFESSAAGSWGASQSSLAAAGVPESGGASAIDVNQSGGGAESALTITGPGSGLGIKVSKQWTETTTSKLTFVLVNQGSQLVELTNVKIRYYFTMDAWETPVFEIYDARKDSEKVNVKAEFFTVNLPGADRYVELSFPRTAPGPIAAVNALQAGGQLTIQSGLHDQNWILANTANDYSYTGIAGFTDRIPIYVGSQLVWGAEPCAELSAAGVGGASSTGVGAGAPPGAGSFGPGAAGARATAELGAGGSGATAGLAGLVGSAGAE